MKCEGQKPPEGNSRCGGTGRKTAICISYVQYAQFLTGWKIFIVQCGYANAALLDIS
jgi:hypothetical protein